MATYTPPPPPSQRELHDPLTKSEDLVILVSWLASPLVLFCIRSCATITTIPQEAACCALAEDSDSFNGAFLFERGCPGSHDASFLSSINIWALLTSIYPKALLRSICSKAFLSGVCPKALLTIRHNVSYSKAWLCRKRLKALLSKLCPKAMVIRIFIWVLLTGCIFRHCWQGYILSHCLIGCVLRRCKLEYILRNC